MFVNIPKPRILDILKTFLPIFQYTKNREEMFSYLDVGLLVGCSDGLKVGLFVGFGEGFCVGFPEGLKEGLKVGFNVGFLAVGLKVGFALSFYSRNCVRRFSTLLFFTE